MSIPPISGATAAQEPDAKPAAKAPAAPAPASRATADDSATISAAGQQAATTSGGAEPDGNGY